MKNILIAISLYIISNVAFATDMSLPIRSVIDVDTIGIMLDLPCPLCRASVRIRGIDTPESNHLAKCEAEKSAGLAAKEFLTNFIANQSTMLARDVKWDKYGGRIDAYIVINGINIGDEMIRLGYARPYTGIGPKSDWCN